MTRSNNNNAKIMLIICSILGCAAVAAQEVARNETVGNRARPELDALGIRIGGFRLFPELGAEARKNSNIFATDADAISDTIYVGVPALALRSDWNRHALNFGADGEILRYQDFTTEDHENYSVFGQARIDTVRGRFFLLDVFHRRRHEDRGSPDDERGFTPTPFDQDRAALSFETPTGPRLFHTRLMVEYEQLDYEDVIGSGGVVNNDDRDRSSVFGSARLGYGFHPAYSIFLQGSAHETEYDFQFDDRGFERSSTGYEVAVGTTLDFSGATFGDIFVGYLSETYDDPRFDTIDGLSFGADLSWNATGLTTITISGRRQVEATTVGETAGRDVVRFGLGIDHELLRNLIFELRGSTATEDFDGIDREDRVRSASFTARYMMNRWIELEIGYRYTDRDVDPPIAGIGFSRNIYSLSVKGQL
ncbi:MAG: outer membrane beta-barrel protein [Gammaproteobacteria bacterium]|nr:outer membrane beta-barrel protein [Gammaproteobacteria bacterium]